LKFKLRLAKKTNNHVLVAKIKKAVKRAKRVAKKVQKRVVKKCHKHLKRIFKKFHAKEHKKAAKKVRRLIKKLKKAAKRVSKLRRQVRREKNVRARKAYHQAQRRLVQHHRNFRRAVKSLPKCSQETVIRVVTVITTTVCGCGKKTVTKSVSRSVQRRK
jgi:hypothetical protein